MLRVLFDKNVPYPLRRYLTGFQVKTAEEEGWSQISNGELISCAEQAVYEVLITCDQNVRNQQNLTHRKISMIVLGSNIWPGVHQKTAQITAALARVSPGSFEFIEIAPHPSDAGCLIRRSGSGAATDEKNCQFCSAVTNYLMLLIGSTNFHHG